MKHLIHIYLILLLCFTLNGQQIILKPDFQTGNDSYVWSEGSFNNYGEKSSILSYTWTDQGNTSNVRGLLKFNLNTIPERSDIESAYLTLYWNPSETTNGIEQHSGENAFWIERAITPWHENIVNWQNQPATTQENRVSISKSNTGTQDYLDIDITNLIKDMVSNPNESYGFVLKMKDERNPYSNVVFASSNHLNKNIHPKLEINYTKTDENCVKIRSNDNYGQDTYIWDKGIFNNYANKPSIHSYTWTHGGSVSIIRGLLNFKLSEIPDNSIVKSANLSLFYNPNSTTNGVNIHSGDNAFYIERITSAWNEKSTNWSNQPSTTAENRVEIEKTLFENQDYLDIDVSNILTDILVNPNEGYGFMLKMKNELSPYRNLIFASSNHPNPTLHPLLEVCYSVISASEDLDTKDLLKMFPNPAQKTIHLDNIPKEYTRLNIRNLEGTLLRSNVLSQYENSLSIDVEHLQSGIYFVELFSAKIGAKTLKLIKL